MALTAKFAMNTYQIKGSKGAAVHFTRGAIILTVFTLAAKSVSYIIGEWVHT